MTGWTVSRAPVSGDIYAHISCPKCKQSMQTDNPDRAVFRHCGVVQFLTADQRALFEGGDKESVDAKLDAQAAANYKAFEIAANAPGQTATFNITEAWAREEAAMRKEAADFAKAKEEQELYNLRLRNPHLGSGAPRWEPFTSLDVDAKNT